MIVRNHTYDITPNTLSALDSALVRFAAKHGVTIQAWYHDLPVWLVRLIRGNSIISVQIDAIAESRIAERSEDTEARTVAMQQYLYFTPDSYEDVRIGEQG